VVLDPEAVGDGARVLVDARLECGDTPGQRSYGASGGDPAPSSLEPTDGGAPCRSRMT
jgi:hypothetical protein